MKPPISISRITASKMRDFFIWFVSLRNFFILQPHAFQRYPTYRIPLKAISNSSRRDWRKLLATFPEKGLSKVPIDILASQRESTDTQPTHLQISWRVWE